MKKILSILLMCCLILGGCGGDAGKSDAEKTSEDHRETTESSQEESKEEQELSGEEELIDDSIDGFENASREYDKFNSYASENGLGGTLIYIEGKVLEQIQNDEVLSVIVEQEDEKRWAVSIMSNQKLDGIEDKDVIVFGTYLGFSDVFNVPSIGIVAEDFSFMNKVRIEVKIDGKYETAWSFMDYVMAESENQENPDENEEEIQKPKADEEETQTPKADDKIESYTPTTGEKNALSSAKNYLSMMAFSYDGLIDQLKYEKYSNEEVVYAVENCGADWNEQALKAAKNYLSMMAFSYTGLIKQLEFEKYTTEQATYGADNCGADWNEQAVKSAKNYLEMMSFSRESLIEQLEFEGFTHEQAVYGAEQNGY